PRGSTREDTLARPKRHAVTGDQHLTRQFAARYERYRNLDLVLTGDQQHIGEVDRRGVDSHQHLARSRDGLGDVVDNEVLGRAVGTADYRSHTPPHRPSKQNRTTCAMSPGPVCASEATKRRKVAAVQQNTASTSRSTS